MLKRRFFNKAVCLAVTFMMLSQQAVLTYAVPHKNDDVLAEVVFSNNLVAKGASVFVGDGDTPARVFEYGQEAWKLDPASGTSNRYIYVDIDDRIAHNLTDGRNILVEVEYYDGENGSLALEYPKFEWKNITISKPNTPDQINVTNATELELLDTYNTQQWKTYTWTLERAWLNNSLNGADFRIGIYSPALSYSKAPMLIRSLKVRDSATNSRMNINVKSENFGHIFYTGDIMKFDVEIDNSVAGYSSKFSGTVPAEITYTLTNSQNQQCGKIVKTANIKPYQIFKDTVEFAPERYDTYILRVDVRSEKKNIYSYVTRECSYVRSTKGKIVNKHAGISVPIMMTNYSGAEYDYAKEVAKIVRYAGYDLARINLTTQQTAMSTYGNYTPNEIATHITFGDSIKALKDQGVKVMMYCTTFTRDTQKHKNALWYEKEGYILPYTDEGRNRLLFNELEILREQNGNVDVWEIGNENNAAPNVTPTKDGYVSETVAMEKLVYSNVKKEFPRIFLGTTQYAVRSTNPWFSNYFKAGGMMNQDFISIHPYMTKGDPVTNAAMDINNTTADQVNAAELYELCKEYGFEGEIWATEYGISPGWHVWAQGDDVQAAYIVSNYLNMTSAEDVIDKMILFRLDERFKGTRKDIEYTYGIIRTYENDFPNRGAAKLGYLAESNKNIMMYDAKYIEKIKLNNNTIGYRYKKAESGVDMFAMFTNKESDIMSVDLGTEEVVLTDLYGNETTLTSDSGVYTFTVSKEPFYCTGNFGKFEIVDSSDVYPKQTYIGTSFGNIAEIDFVNNTDEALDVDFELNGKSQLKVPEGLKIQPGTSKIKIECGTGSFMDIEKVLMTVKGKDGVKFKGNVLLDYKNVAIKLSAKLENENGRWYISNIVTNSSDNTTVSGQVKLMYPYELADKVEPINGESKPGTFEKYKMPLPADIETGESINITTAFVRNDGAPSIYNTQRLDFIYAPKASGVKIDGDLSEWDSGWMYLNNREQFEQLNGYRIEYSGPNDVWAKTALKWDEENLYFAAEVHDDVFYSTGYEPKDTWNLDSMQLAFLYDPDGKIKSTSTFEEIAFSYLDKSSVIYRHKTIQQGLADATKVEGSEISIVENGDTMYYEVKLPWASLLPDDYALPTGGTEFKFALILNENDGLGRKGYYKIGDGIGNGKNSSKFLTILLAE